MIADEKIAEIIAENTRLKSENNKLLETNKWLEEKLRLAVHRRFGASSERHVMPEQLGLFNEAEITSNETIPEPTIEETITYKRKKTKGKRKEFYDGIPTEQVMHELSEDERVCAYCEGQLHACGQKVLRKELEVIPARVRAVEHVQKIYSCRACENKAIDESVPMVKANVPAPVIPNSGIASPSLLAYISCNKYLLHLPLYRQEQELKRLGINIPRQNMANWVIKSSTDWLSIIYNLLHTRLRKCEIVHADETSLQVINEPDRKASQNSYAWMYHTGKEEEQQIALFDYQPTRGGEHPLAFLQGFSGYLQVDGYAGYKKLEKHGVTLVECWAHARRKFDEALKALRKDEHPKAKAYIGLDFCNQLFALERKYDELNLVLEKRHEMRNLEARPILEAFFSWCESMIHQTMPKSHLGIAVRYAVNQRSWLTNFLLDPRLELSNNRAENSIRPFTVGRKNWMFSFSPKGAVASMTIYSIIETAKSNNLVPFLYLKYLFEKLPNLPSDRYDECLPWHPDVLAVCKIPTS